MSSSTTPRTRDKCWFAKVCWSLADIWFMTQNFYQSPLCELVKFLALAEQLCIRTPLIKLCLCFKLFKKSDNSSWHFSFFLILFISGSSFPEISSKSFIILANFFTNPSDVKDRLKRGIGDLLRALMAFLTVVKDADFFIIFILFKNWKKFSINWYVTLLKIRVYPQLYCLMRVDLWLFSRFFLYNTHS